MLFYIHKSVIFATGSCSAQSKVMFDSLCWDCGSVGSAHDVQPFTKSPPRASFISGPIVLECVWVCVWHIQGFRKTPSCPPFCVCRPRVSWSTSLMRKCPQMSTTSVTGRFFHHLKDFDLMARASKLWPVTIQNVSQDFITARSLCFVPVPNTLELTMFLMSSTHPEQFHPAAVVFKSIFPVL